MAKKKKNYRMTAEPGVIGAIPGPSHVEEKNLNEPKWITMEFDSTCAKCIHSFGGCMVQGKGKFVEMIEGSALKGKLHCDLKSDA